MKLFQSTLLGVLLALSLTGAQKVKEPTAKECKTRWFDRDNPSGTGDYELLSQFWDENPDIICPQPLAIEVQTVDGIPASQTGQKFAVNDATSGFNCINSQQGKGESCRDYKVRFSCPDSYCPTASSSPATLTPETLPPVQTFRPEPELTPSAEGQKGEPTPQAPLRPETTLPPTQTPHLGPEQTTSGEGQKGAPTPQVPLRRETTLPPAQTPHLGQEQTTIPKGGPTPQVPLIPETTLPPAQTPHLGPEQTTILKGAPTPQVPLRPETTLPPAQTPHLGPEQTTILKGAPTPQVPLRPETTLPPAQTLHLGPEQTTILKGAPTPQVPLRPETTLPPAQTPHIGLEQTTILKGAPTPQVPLRPETTLPPAQTHHPGPEQTTILKGEPTPQVPLRPETTLPPAQTPHLGPEQTTILKGAPTPQVPLRPETTLPPAQTPHLGPEQTTILKGAPTPQVPLRPETTLPPAQTPHLGPEQTTILKGEPTPQVPLRPETTLPPAQTPYIGPEVTTIAEVQKGAPTAKGQLRPETIFPPAQTPHPGPEQTTSAESQKGENDDPFKEKEEEESGEEDFASPAPTADSEQSLTHCPQKVCKTRWFDEDDPSGTGDYELFFDIADKYPNDICSEPTAIEVQTLDGTPASETRQIFTINDAHTGFSCIHASQGKGKRCHDYQVRFTCPLSFCSGGEILSTPGPELGTPPAPTPTLEEIKGSPKIPVKGGEIPFTPGPEPVTSSAPTPTLEEIKGSPKIPVKGGEIQSTPAAEPVTPPAPTLALEQAQSSPNPPAKGNPNQPGEGLEPVTLLAPTAVSPEVKTGSQVQEQVCKTNWFDRDNPSGTGDYELLSDIMDENEIDTICLDPVAIEVQTVDGIPASQTGQQFAVNDAARGFACINAHQGKGVLCLDYRVRFTCPAAFCAGKGQPGVESTSAVTSVPLATTQQVNQFPTQGQDQSGLTPAASTPVDSVLVLTTTAATPIDTVPIQTTPQSPAPVCKTKWLNRDNPTATGDYELIYYLKKDYPKAICNKPIAIEVQTVDGIPASQTGQIFSRNDAVSGFACINAQQGKRGVCHDYKVRFTCPDSFCSGNDQGSVKKESP